MHDPAVQTTPDAAAAVVSELTRRGLRIAVAESLTGGLVLAELTRIAGASAVVSGGIVAYDSAVKRSLLDVSAELLNREGAVHPDVAREMADGVRRALAIDGRAADIGVATTGVAGPSSQDGKPPGTVYVAVATDEAVDALELRLQGDRGEIRAATVDAVIRAVLTRIGRQDRGVR